jgi:Leucine-rich repeat (LRR) protein
MSSFCKLCAKTNSLLHHCDFLSRQLTRYMLLHMHYLWLLLLQLADVPEVVFYCTALRTLGLGVNALTTVAHLPWTALIRLERLDLSNNQITDIGDVCIMTWLRHLSLENNAVSDHSAIKHADDVVATSDPISARISLL